MVIVFDLDDTLYDEIDFVKSGFKEISRYLNNTSYYDFMLKDFYENGSGRVFNNLIDKFKLDVSLQKLIDIYRFHLPDITLPSESLNLLNYSKNHKTALISDGFYLMQQNKFNSLGLDKYIEYPVFTDFYHTNKPEQKAFKMVMEKFNDENDFVYVSDNPRKDFLAPNTLGWKSIRYKNLLGVYKQYKSDATYEVNERSDIEKLLKELENEQ